jgi:hypothetical protein
MIFELHQQVIIIIIIITFYIDVLYDILYDDYYMMIITDAHANDTRWDEERF